MADFSGPNSESHRHSKAEVQPDLSKATFKRRMPKKLDRDIVKKCGHCGPGSPDWKGRITEMILHDLYPRDENDPAARATKENIKGLLAFEKMVNRFADENRDAFWGSMHEAWRRIELMSGLSQCRFQTRLGIKMSELRNMLWIPLEDHYVDTELVYKFEKLSRAQQDEVRAAVFAANPYDDLLGLAAKPFLDRERNPTTIFFESVAELIYHNRNSGSAKTKPRGIVARCGAFFRTRKRERLIRDPKFLEETSNTLDVLFGAKIPPRHPALAVFLRMSKEQQGVIKDRMFQLQWNELNEGRDLKIPFPRRMGARQAVRVE